MKILLWLTGELHLGGRGRKTESSIRRKRLGRNQVHHAEEEERCSQLAGLGRMR